MPKISQKDRDARRHQIREAAFRCFARKGVQATTMRDIFAEASLSAGAVYNYFQTKEELIESGIAESADANVAAIIAASQEADFLRVIDVFWADLEAAAVDGRAKVTPLIQAEVILRPELLSRFRRGRDEIQETALAALAQLRPDLSAKQQALLLAAVFALYEGLVISIAVGEEPDLGGLRSLIGDLLENYGRAGSAK